MVRSEQSHCIDEYDNQLYNYAMQCQSAGIRVEALRMQNRENLTRMSVIIAVRLLQLRFIHEEPAAQRESCETLLGTKSWRWSRCR